MNAFDFGGWQCDPKSLTLKSKDMTVRLELKVMTVLHILAISAPNVVSRDELMTAAWPGVIVSDGAMYRVIALLRRALNDREKPHKYIESIPRVGYRLMHEANIHKTTTPTLSPKEQLRRASITIIKKGQSNHPELNLSITTIERHIGWRCPMLSIQRPNTKTQCDYQVEISLSRNEKNIELQWQIMSINDSELIHSDLHNEARLSPEPLPPRVAELVAESITRQTLLHRRKQIDDTSEPMSLNYWDLINLGDRFVSMQSEQIALRRSLLSAAISIAPAVAEGHAALGKFLAWEVINGVAKNTKKNVNHAIESAARAMDIEPSSPYVASSCGLIYSQVGKHNLGIELCRQSLMMAPSAQSKDALAMALCFAGEPDGAIDLYLQIFASMPAGQIFHFGKLVLPLAQSGQIERALEYADLCTIYHPGDFFSWVLRCNILAQLGNLDGAKADLLQAKKLMPSLNLQNLIAGMVRSYGRTESQRQGLTSGYARMLEGAGT